MKHIVWFKRDLRVHDHAALTEAAAQGEVLPLYILEPELWQQPDMSYRHYRFLQQALESLSDDVKALGQPLLLRVGEAVPVLEALRQHYGDITLWSHQETWNGWTYARDKAVLAWCRSHGITWHEPRQYGVVRRLQDRNGWAAGWYKLMKQPVLPAPTQLHGEVQESDAWPSADALGLVDDGCTQLQKGGRVAALRDLASFLNERGEHYTKAMSSPVVAYDTCSRLSAHVAFGTLSMREVFHAMQQRNAELASIPPDHRGRWPNAMRSFAGRLRWHCHFMQKLEDEPRIEFENMHSAYDGLHEDAWNQAHVDAWAEGRTGYPMVDACMRALKATGWLNFRMRAMVMSFASYHLWLHWREPSLYLARLFTDYEPGIHYSQCQMQSGTTGINSIRIYNPIKQSQDHDPDGVFIRKWIPELSAMPDEHIHTPWNAPEHMQDYPMPIVEEKAARKAAADKLYGLRRGNAGHKAEAQAIVQKHGSRKSGLPRTTGRKRRKQQDAAQGELPL